MAIHNEILYTFIFKDGEKKKFLLKFDELSLELLPNNYYVPPSWADLNIYKCPLCPLDPTVHRYCPTAVNLAWIFDDLKSHNSFEEVTVEVIDDMRTYIKETSIQDGLGSLLEIVMPTGGCPILKPLRPMVRFHLPFASLEEMEYRMVSMYLFSQYLRQKRGEAPDWTLEGLKDIYVKVEEVNKSFSKRVSLSSSSDSAKNAVIILDCFAKSVTRAIENMLKNHKTTFANLES